MTVNKTNNHLPQGRVFKTIIFTVISLTAINSFFIRGFILPFETPVGNSTSVFIPFFIILLLIMASVILLREGVKLQPKIGLLVFSLIIIPTSSLIYNLHSLQDSTIVILFFSEFYLNILLLISTIILLKYIQTQSILDVLWVAGIVFSLAIIYYAIFELETFRRVGNQAGGFGGGVNHMSHALATSFVIGFCRYYRNQVNRKLTFLSLIIILSAMVMTGSRSAFIGVILAVVVGIILIDELSFLTFVKLSIIVSAIFAFLLPIVVEITSLNHLLSPSNIYRSLTNRIYVYSDGLDELFANVTSMLFGVGVDQYMAISATQEIYDPHNIWISHALYLGVPTFVVFFLLHFSVTLGLFRSIISEKVPVQTDVTLLLVLIVVSIYAFFSGRMTRIFTIWIVLGIAIEQLISLSQKQQ